MPPRPVESNISRPLNRVTFWRRPRIDTLVPSAMPRSTCTPDTRDSDSATLRSGSLPMSSATMESTIWVALRLALRADSRLRRMPVTMIVSGGMPSGWAAAGADGGCATGPTAAGAGSCAKAGVVSADDSSRPKMVTCLMLHSFFIVFIEACGAPLSVQAQPGLFVPTGCSSLNASLGICCIPYSNKLLDAINFLMRSAAQFLLRQIVLAP